ncbi:F-box protein FBX14-like [Zingiber officinale]|uniref:F-box protein FBX14-like n=1 Tax=Zingiber officinale TaxID=94328 RepID=UPI001C4C90F2|nr:F-box protein FBX14-like [Zingiber officinale]
MTDHGDAEEEDNEKQSRLSPSRGSSSAGSGGGCQALTSKSGDEGRGLVDVSPPCSDQVLKNVIENVIEYVLEFLTCRRDRNAASMVCRSWYRAEAQTRREIFIGNCFAVSPTRAVARFRFARALVLKGRGEWGSRFSPWVTAMAAPYPWLERVCLKHMTVSDADLGLLARSFPSFGDLTLISCSGFGTRGLADVAGLCRNLRVLDLISSDVKDEDEQVADWISRFPETTTCLESLSFECVTCMINFAALEALVTRSPHLRCLRVNQHVSVHQLRRLMERAPPQLAKLGTGSFRWVPAAGAPERSLNLDLNDFESAFAACKSLVCLSGFRMLEYLHLPYAVCSNLISLNLMYALITPEQLELTITECYNLRTFWVLETIGDKGLKLVAEICKDLTELRVFPINPSMNYYSDGVSDSGLMAIAEGCPKLRTILYFCRGMTNAAMVTMSQNCPDLVVFRLWMIGRYRPDRVTGEPMDEGFGAIVMNCKKLTRLAISGLLTDKVFEYIVNRGKLIRTLSVWFAQNTEPYLKYVLEGCPNLQRLEINGSNFSYAELLSAIHRFYNMRIVWLNLGQISLRTCKEVARRLPHLVVMWCQGQDIFSGKNVYLYRSLDKPRKDESPVFKIL